MFSGSFGVRSIVLCKCSGNVPIGYWEVLGIRRLIMSIWVSLS